jgi:sugar transferase (PEP-CTERM/EpsH1 system associated)
MEGVAASQRPVRVLHLVPELSLGGMEQGVVTLLNGLVPEQIAGSVCSFDSGIDSIRERLDPRIPVHVLGRRSGNDPMLVWRLIRVLRRERPDVVHSHTWGTVCEGYVATRLAGVRHFVHGEHGTLELRPRNLRIQRWVWSRADRVLSVSSKLADRMAREVGFPRNRMQVIRNGADLVKFGVIPRAEARESLRIPDTEFVIGTVGRLVPVKDHEMLFAALVHLRNAGVRCLALVAGEGPLRSELEERVRALDLGSMLRFLGNRDDVDRVLAMLDVFVLTSVSEGLPNSILEAMASGLPVVSTHVGGVEELVENGKTGMLVPSKNAEMLADAVSTLARDAELRRRMGAQGQKKARAEFGLRRMLDEYARFYLELSGRSTQRPDADSRGC